MDIENIVQKQREFFKTGKTKDVNFRKKALKDLKTVIINRQEEINNALKLDLNKSETESYMAEIGMVLSELSYAIKHVNSWAKSKRVQTPLAQFHSKSYYVSEPYGVSLIIAPWNYPFMLALDPLVGSIAAGNCCVLKASRNAPNTCKILQSIISDIFPSEYITVIGTELESTSELLNHRFDYIFFTGSVRVGKMIMESASKYLTPVTLELGGKSPCIVEKTANIPLAAKRIMFGKVLNAGQTCVAPDYILVQKDVKDELIKEMKKSLTKFLGENPIDNDNYTKIINKKQFERIKGLLENQNIILGGKFDEEKQKIEPTFLDEPDENSAVMQEEIFGPIFPIISYENIEEVIEFVQKREKPLALYLFTQSKKVQKLIQKNLSFGGGCINDTIIHLASSKLGFGGVGNSGMGAYHGKRSFDTFSHEKSIVKKYTWLDLPMRYMPYTKGKLKIIKMFLK